MLNALVLAAGAAYFVIVTAQAFVVLRDADVNKLRFHTVDADAPPSSDESSTFPAETFPGETSTVLDESPTLPAETFPGETSTVLDESPTLPAEYTSTLPAEHTQTFQTGSSTSRNETSRLPAGEEPTTTWHTEAIHSIKRAAADFWELIQAAWGSVTRTFSRETMERNMHSVNTGFSCFGESTRTALTDAYNKVIYFFGS